MDETEAIKSPASEGMGEPTLPPFAPACSPDSAYMWGSLDGPTMCDRVIACYSEVIYWKRNVFRIPSGKAGKAFVSEMAKLFQAFAEENRIESFALTAAVVLPHLLLQKPHKGSKMKDHTRCLNRRLQLWLNGDVEGLLTEGRTIQQRLGTHRPSDRGTEEARAFANLMKKGKVKDATRLLSDDSKGTPLPLDLVVNTDDSGETVRDVLHKKFPPRRPLVEAALQADGPEQHTHPIIFESITGPLIRTTALHTSGSAGPSGMDAQGWRRMCTSFHDASQHLCEAIAAVARRLCTSLVDPKALRGFTCSRLIALDKQPGVRPVGIGEVSRRIIGKAVLSVIKDDILRVAGVKQLCVGQQAGCEAAIHALRCIFDHSSTEAILLVDATNAFNNLSRKTALINIQHSCPSLAIILINTYRQDPEFYIEGEAILSTEGTTQGDPLAMAMFALAMVPLIDKMSGEVQQIWYADDASAGGKMDGLRAWWDKITELGPEYGYFPNPAKTWLVVKEEHLETAQNKFEGSGIQLTTQGRQYLGAPIGSKEFVELSVKKKVDAWAANVEKLASIAKTHPHAAYAAYCHGLRHRWKFIMRTTPIDGVTFTPLETTIRNHLLPSISGKWDISDSMRKILAMPTRCGGLGLANPQEEGTCEYAASCLLTRPLVDLILQQEGDITPDCYAKKKQAKTTIIRQKLRHTAEATAGVLEKVPVDVRRMIELAAEKGASSWLTTLPIEEHGFHLNKTAFWDAIYMRYGWKPERMPEKCVCSAQFSVEHALTCPRGGFTFIRHNEIRDLTANLLSEVCHGVQTEPDLQPLTGETLSLQTANGQDNARLDIRARGFWGERRQDAFFDVRVFNPHASSNRLTSPGACYRKHEKEKRRKYEERIREVEHGTFTPLVFSATGGMGTTAEIFYKRLASLISEKNNQDYATTMGWIRCCISFSLIRSAVMCVRGSRSSYHHPISPSSMPADLVATEGRVTRW